MFHMWYLSERAVHHRHELGVDEARFDSVPDVFRCGVVHELSRYLRAFAQDLDGIQAGFCPSSDHLHEQIRRGDAHQFEVLRIGTASDVDQC